MRKAIVRSIGDSFTFEVVETEKRNSNFKEGQKTRFGSCGELLHEVREFLEGERLREEGEGG